MFKVNTAVDAAITEPIARGYTAVIPSPIRDCVGNMFDNLKVPFSALNNVLQGKLQAACEDVTRFALNTTAGLAGCFDIATKVGLPNHKEDLGQTLAVWGVPAGPYVMLPLLGPSNVRDGLARIGQMAMNAPVDRNLISTDIEHIPTRNTLLGMNLIQARAELLPATDALKKMGVDEYAFVRDSSINRRQNQVYDGNPPDEPNSDDVTDNSSDSNSANEPTASTVSQ
jgi:phospholipid-binding lipoprotein MlaA